MAPGAPSSSRPPKPDEIEFLTSDKIRNLIAAKTTVVSSTGTFVPVLLTSQVVAGTIYQVKYDLGTKHVHAKIFRPLPCYPNDPPEMMSFKDDCSRDTPLSL